MIVVSLLYVHGMTGRFVNLTTLLLDMLRPPKLLTSPVLGAHTFASD